MDELSITYQSASSSESLILVLPGSFSHTSSIDDLDDTQNHAESGALTLSSLSFRSVVLDRAWTALVDLAIQILSHQQNLEVKHIVILSLVVALIFTQVLIEFLRWVRVLTVVGLILIVGWDYILAKRNDPRDTRQQEMQDRALL